jgi:hypothetical protein
MQSAFHSRAERSFPPSLDYGGFKQTARGFGSLKLFGGANDAVQFLNRRVLVVNRKLRITNDVAQDQATENHLGCCKSIHSPSEGSNERKRSLWENPDAGFAAGGSLLTIRFCKWRLWFDRKQRP